MNDRDVLLKGATLLHLDPPKVERADVRVKAGVIEEVGHGLSPAGDERLVDESGALVMPGLVCGHHHLYSALACGMPLPSEPPTSFADMLDKVWWRLDKALDRESVEVSALVGAVQALRSGCTTIIDHHASPSFIDGSLEVMDAAVDGVGLRRVLCYEVTDRGGPEEAKAGQHAHLGMLRAGPTGMSAALVGVHASFTVSDETLSACGRLARDHGVGVHIHVGEAADDRALTKEPLIDRLERCGALLEKSVLAHCVHVAPDELRRIEDAGAFIAHQARSNMNNAVGYAPTARFPVDQTVLGTDGIDGDMLTELKAAYFRAQEAKAGLGPDRFLKMLTTGARLAGELLGVKLGRIAPGYAADLVMLDPLPGPPLSLHNLAAALVFRLSPALVRSVMVGGRFLLKDRVPVHVDESALAIRAERAAVDLWQRMRKLPVKEPV